MARLSLSLLGPVQVTLDGHPVTGFEYAKVRALLVYLAVESGSVHSRDVLAALLWPDLPDGAARTNLRQVLTTLRHAIADHAARPAVLLISRETIQFNPASDHALDVWAFQTLIATCETHPHRGADSCSSCARRWLKAVSLYRGDFLAQFFLPDSAGFEEWAALKRERLHQQARGALACLTAYYERRQAYSEATRYARWQVELDPWNEEAHQQLMRTLWLRGQRSEALAQYERCRQLLQQELGIAPALETTALYERIRNAARSMSRAHELQAPIARLAHNLPAPATPLLGREVDLAQLADLLDRPACRLITLVGPGGIGKTRLALHAATEQLGMFADGIWLVQLAALSSADLLVPSIAASLGTTLDDRADHTAQLLSSLREKELLLVLDNFEHLLEGAGLLAELLQRAPRVSVLVTSRERLRLPGEWTVEVEGLPYPREDETTDLEHYSAAALFLIAARRATNGFTLTTEESAWVARICRLVEGMPLAIELAASWARVLTCREIAEELEGSLDFLTSTERARAERHRSLRTVLDHSWNLLAPQEQRVLRQLAVFRGGFDRMAATAVAGASPSMLAALVDKSLLRRSASGRYDLHELVRQFAEEQLDAVDTLAAEAAQTRGRHLGHYLQLAEEAAPHFRGHAQTEWLKRLEAEHGNLRAVLAHCQASTDEGELHKGLREQGLRLVGALWRFWFLRGYLAEWQYWVTALGGEMHDATEQRNDPGGDVTMQARRESEHAYLAEVLLGRAFLAHVSDGGPRASELAAASLACFQKAGNRWGCAAAGAIVGARTPGITGLEHLEGSLAWARQMNDAWLIAWALFNLGGFPKPRTPLVQAVQRYEESLALARQAGDRWLCGLSLVLLAGVIIDLYDDYARARALLHESLTAFRELGDDLGTMLALADLGEVAWLQRDYGAAQQAYGESLRMARAVGHTWNAASVQLQLGWVTLAHGDVATSRRYFHACLEAGREGGALPLAYAHAYAGLGTCALVEGDTRDARERWQECLAVADGSTDRQGIAWALYGLGRVAQATGDAERAQALLEEGLRSARDAGASLVVAGCLVSLAARTGGEGDAMEVARIFGAATREIERAGSAIALVQRILIEQDIVRIRPQVDERAWATTYTEGRAIPLAEVLAPLVQRHGGM